MGNTMHDELVPLSKLHQSAIDIAREVSQKGDFDPRNAVDVSVDLIFAKARQSALAVSHLCEAGFGTDAQIILRTMLESLINMRWILWPTDEMERKRRGVDFCNHEWTERRRILQRLRTSDLWSLFSAEGKATIDIACGPKIPSGTSWAGLTVAKRAVEVGLESEYLLKYAMLSGAVHGDFTGLRMAVHLARDGRASDLGWPRGTESGLLESVYILMQMGFAWATYKQFVHEPLQQTCLVAAALRMQHGD